MERVVISRKTLEALVREVLEVWEYTDLGVADAECRRVAVMLDEAIEALGIQQVLDAEQQARRQQMADEWRAQQAAKEDN
mgnify:CR=1 FL=1|jgi:hypothetical protein